MGIKFHCPNGHKLNVKSFLAGKKGVCPKCGTKVRIPTASEPGLVDSDLEETDAAHAGAAKSNGSGVVAAGPAPAAPAVAVAPSAPTAAQLLESPAADDPIAEAPTAIWYVRPPTGGQYGPARGEIMRKWISEGRVSSDSLVWREGWTDWQSAGKLFPTLQVAGGVATIPAVSPAVSTTVPLTPRATSRIVARHEPKKRDNSAVAVALLAGLGLVCLVLVGVLVYVLVSLK